MALFRAVAGGFLRKRQITMCGIAGFFYHQAIDSDARAKSLAALKPRGPDRQNEIAWHNNKKVLPNEAADSALIHTRLAIRDLSDSADQPMANAENNVFLLFNGEVFDWESHKKTLENQGFVFKTTSDTEFILNAYLAYGFPKMLDFLRGFFAIVIVDFRVQKIFSARDRLGLKPLIYGQTDEGFLFSSTVRGALPFLKQRTLSQKALDAFLAHRYIPAPLTIFKELKRLENAHFVVFDLKTQQLSTPQKYWTPTDFQKNSAFTVENEIQKSVAMRLVSERPLGLFLSSGIDSSAIAGVLQTIGKHPQTFTAAFDSPEFDESVLAEKIAQTLGFSNQKIAIPNHIANDFAQIVADLDEPFADPSAFPTWFLARQTSQHVRVVLGGDGGDELFAGYKRYAKHLRTKLRPQFSFLPAIASLHKKAKILDEWRATWRVAYALRFSGFAPHERRFLTAEKNLPPIYWRAPDFEATSPINQLIALDFANTLPEYILKKTDLCTMAHGLEMRAPLLDHILVSTIFALPDSVRFTKPPKKILAPCLKKLESLNLFAQKKRGFNPPLKHWLSNDLRERFDGLGERLEKLSDGFLQKSAVDIYTERFQKGETFRAERVLQLFIADESLSQLTQ